MLDHRRRRRRRKTRKRRRRKRQRRSRNEKNIEQKEGGAGMRLGPWPYAQAGEMPFWSPHGLQTEGDHHTEQFISPSDCPQKEEGENSPRS